MKKTREYVEIVRKIFKRESNLEFEGEYYNLPLSGEGTTNLGKPLRLIENPLRKDIEIYLAAIGPKNIELTAEIADGWLPFMYSPTKGDNIFNKYLDLGFEKSNNPDKKNTFEISAPVYARICEEEEKEAYLSPARSTYLSLIHI